MKRSLNATHSVVYTCQEVPPLHIQLDMVTGEESVVCPRLMSPSPVWVSDMDESKSLVVRGVKNPYICFNQLIYVFKMSCHPSRLLYPGYASVYLNWRFFKQHGQSDGILFQV